MPRNARGDEQAAGTKSVWELASTRIGVVAAAVGLLVALLGLPKKIAEAFAGEDPKVAAEREEALAKAEASRPRLDVRYQVVSGYLAHRIVVGDDGAGADSARRDSAGRSAVRTLLALPVVQTEPVAAYGREDPTGERGTLELPDTAGAEYHEQGIVFLLVENRGRRDAANVTLHADQLFFGTAVPVNEAAAGGTDYVAAMRQRSTRHARVTIGIPRTLAPGDGVLVPLFVNAADQRALGKWWVVSRSALLPDSLTYLDATIAAQRSTPVRRMVNPSRVTTGVLDRG